MPVMDHQVRRSGTAKGLLNKSPGIKLTMNDLAI
jgi:hypothetical protein